jgi:ATP-dependent DNA ligase
MCPMNDVKSDTQTAGSVLSGLRPQPFTVGNPGRVVDPLVEPMWAGMRALAAIDGVDVEFANESGDPIDGHADVRAALADAASAERLVLDGFLTKLAARDGSGAYVPLDDLPTSGQLASRQLLGIRRSQTDERMKALEAERAAQSFGPDDVVSYVAVDLLWLDGEPLVDVPLLERRRHLDSVLDESDLVRRGIYVRPPLEAWIGSWRSLGFTELTFKAANSRYRPGTVTNEWVSVPMPRR